MWLYDTWKPQGSVGTSAYAYDKNVPNKQAQAPAASIAHPWLMTLYRKVNVCHFRHKSMNTMDKTEGRPRVPRVLVWSSAIQIIL